VVNWPRSAAAACRELAFTNARGGVLLATNYRTRIFGPAVQNCQKADETFQKNRFACPAPSEHGDDAAARHYQVDRGQHNVLAELFAQAGDLQNGWKRRTDHTRKQVIK